VRLDDDTYAGLKAYFLNIACHRQADFLAQEFWELPFEPYRPVRVQLLNILRAVNRARFLAGYEQVPVTVIRFKRNSVRPFGGDPMHQDAGTETERDAVGDAVATFGTGTESRERNAA